MFLFIAFAVYTLSYITKLTESYAPPVEQFSSELKLLCEDGDEDACTKLIESI